MATKIKGLFERVDPGKFAEKVGIPLGWMVISHHHIPDKQERRKVHGRWYRVTSQGISVFRVLRFAPNLHFDWDGTSDLVIDWVGWLDLHGRASDVDGPLELEIEQVSPLLLPMMIVMHPDPTSRLAGWIALVSLALGVLSILLVFK